MKKNIFKLSIFAFLAIFVLSGCSLLDAIKGGNKKIKEKEITYSYTPHEGFKTVEEELQAQSNIKKFASLDDVEEFLENNETSGSRNSYNSWGRGSIDMLETSSSLDKNVLFGGLDAPMAKSSVQSESGMGGGSDDFSTTNVQVEGVDEADIIKTDGEYIYALVKNDLYIVDAYPASKSKILSKISFKSRPQDMYLNDGKLVVFGHDNQIRQRDFYKEFRRRGNYMFFKVFDMENPKKPKQIRDISLEGNYSNSRMIGEHVYFVTNNYNHYYIEDEPILPRIIEDDVAYSLNCDEKGVKCIEPDVYYFDVPYNSYNFTSVYAINVADKNEKIGEDVYIMSSNQNMYVSQNNIYITYTKHVSEYKLAMEVMKDLVLPRLSAKNQEKIAKIEAVDSFILSEDEKMNKITRILEAYSQSLTDDEGDKLEDELEEAMKQKYEDISKELEKTVIHRVAVNKNNLDYEATGDVTGHVLNQFSMDENNGYFRIATTKNRNWSRWGEETRESYNNLYVLDQDLKQVGAVEGLAEGERIYSVRFMQDRAYMVTFKQTDPLFVIDLKSPSNPKVLGELKIPGFSNYLHPYDNETLIGLGKDTKENEWGGVTTKGVKLSLFDVSDVSKPKEIDTYILGDTGSDSIANHDHKAFLFSLDKNLLSIPVKIREDVSGRRGWGKFVFGGAVVFEVDKEEGFKLKGKVDHSDGKEGQRDYWGGYSYYDNTVKRSLYIDDILYTFSNKYLMMNKISDLDEVKKMKLEKNKSDDGDDFEVIN